MSTDNRSGPETGLAFAQRVRSNPGFRAFASVLGLRIGCGKSLDALYMLRSIGCEDSIAHAIIDKWPTRRNRFLEMAGLSLQEEAACRFACFVGDELERRDWPSLLRQALEGIDRKAARRGR